ncbi:hypothetical protein Ait01nite_050010 [Actinoplanes italicus]|nr:hypothetical protein Ait01nite_050010 [Actinoplanes italicus]
MAGDPTSRVAAVSSTDRNAKRENDRRRRGIVFMGGSPFNMGSRRSYVDTRGLFEPVVLHAAQDRSARFRGCDITAGAKVGKYERGVT